MYSRMELTAWVTVLIDTWWNVNMDQGMLYQTADAVLIDTWWNVNVKITFRIVRS